MATHLAGTSTRWGAVAVMVFYMLSGYLATLQTSAKNTRPIPFLASRWLRLWPSYICVFLLTLMALNFGLIDSIGGATAWWQIVVQATMIAPAWPIGAVVAPAWMLKYILLGYVLIAFGAVNTPARSAIALIISILWANSIALMPDLPYGGYYLSAAFALQFIFAGAACYHMGLVLPRDGRWAAFAGALSYPVFLAHYGVGAAMATLTGLSTGWPLFWFSLTPTLCLSWLLVLWVEQPIARYRRRPTP